jgi:P4 family phage/plasmid primase-like protien
MAERLGVERDKVPVPTTPYSGISSLEYFDADDGGQGSRRKPLCSLPCIVFGMVGLDGELTGAIRVYLDRSGRAKAVLGLDAGGKERKVKPFSPGTKSGGEVRFGNAATTTVKIVCEGVETGAAIAYAAAQAGEAERTLIACGGTAGFMAAIDRQPRILRLIAACDRDEKPKRPDKPASKTGQNKGAELLMRHHEDVSSSLALPGFSGEGVDWLDILRRDGADAVWNGIIHAPAFKPPPIPIEAAEDDEVGPRMLQLGSDVEIARQALADLEARYGKVVYAEGSFWRYSGTHWLPFDESSLRLHVHSFDGSTYATAKGMSVIKLTRRQIDSILNEMIPIAGMNGNSETFAETVPGINCLNGFIVFNNEGEATLLPHSPEHRCRHVIAAEWSRRPVDENRMRGSLLSRLLVGCFKSDASGKRSDKEVEEARKDAEDKIKVLAEVMGAAALGMATRIQAPKAVVLLGPSAQNGKSQVLDIIRGLLPPSAVSSIPAGKMGDEKHLIQLVGKLLNMSDELSSAESIAGDNFKKVVTGNDIEARDVFKSAISFRPKAQHVFATNGLPSFKGGIDRGVRRRLIVLEFNRVIPPSERVAEIGQRIAREELDLLLDFAVEGASRLLKQGKFTDLRSSEDAVRKWVLHTDPVEAWLEECVTCVSGTDVPRVATSEAYSHFREWCGRSGYTLVPPINKFSERVETAGKGIGKVRDSKGRYFTGMVYSEEGRAFRSFGTPY